MEDFTAVAEKARKDMAKVHQSLSTNLARTTRVLKGALTRDLALQCKLHISESLQRACQQWHLNYTAARAGEHSESIEKLKTEVAKANARAVDAQGRLNDKAVHDAELAVQKERAGLS